MGADGGGLGIALSSIGNVGGTGVVAVALGIVHGCLEEGTKCAQRRALYGKPIAEPQAIRWHPANLYMDYEISRWLVYRAAWLRDQSFPRLLRVRARMDAGVP